VKIIKWSNKQPASMLTICNNQCVLVEITHKIRGQYMTKLGVWFIIMQQRKVFTYQIRWYPITHAFERPSNGMGKLVLVPLE